MKLYRTICCTDCRNNPAHTVKLIASSDDRVWLIQQQHSDVEKWQAEDIKDYNNPENDPAEPRTEWTFQNEDGDSANELEISPKAPTSQKGLRQFVETYADGTICTTCYHIQED